MHKYAIILAALFLGACIADTDDTSDTDETEVASEEPNDTKTEAYALTLPATVDAAIEPVDASDDIDWYSFEASGEVNVAITAVDSGLELYLYVEHESGSTIVSWDTGSRGATFDDVFTAPEAGTYYMRIESAYVGDTGAYTLSVQ